MNLTIYIYRLGHQYIEVSKVGSLIVKFNIAFPKQLNTDQKKKFIKALRNELDE